MIYQNFITADFFLNFMKNDVFFLCIQTKFKNSNSIIIMNNAKIHIFSKLNKICEKTSVILTKLSSYSFDYNFIKISFAMLKQ